MNFGGVGVGVDGAGAAGREGDVFVVWDEGLGGLAAVVWERRTGVGDWLCLPDFVLGHVDFFMAAASSRRLKP